MIGRLIERLFVQVRADLSQMSQELQDGVRQTRAATGQMAAQWSQVEASIQALTREFQRGKVTQGDYMRQLNQHVKSMSQLGMEYRQAQSQVHGYAGALAKAARAQAVVTNTAPIQRFNRSLGQSRMQMLNLGYQLNDIGMTLATGMNPMTVLIQQGSQILQIYAGQGGVRAALGDISKMLVGIGKRLWPIAVLAAGFGLLQREINKMTSTSVTFGDTVKAVFQVLGRYIYPFIEGPLGDLMKAWKATLDFIGEWFPKIMNAVVGSSVASVKIIMASWDLLPDMWHDTWTVIKNFALQFIEDIANLITQTMVPTVVSGLQRVANTFKFVFESIKIIWGQLPAIIGDAIGGAVNAVVSGAEKMVNAAISGINKLLAGLQAVMDFIGADAALEFFGFSGKLTPITEADLSSWRRETGQAMDDTSGAIGKAAGEIFRENYLEEAASISPTDLSGQTDTYRNAYGQLGQQIGEILKESMTFDYAGTFFEDVKSQAIENALRRIAKQAEDAGGAASRAADEIKELMEKLDEGLTTSADNLAGVFGSAFERLAETGRFTFSDLIQDLNQLIIKSTSELLQEELSNIFKELATSKGGLGGLFSNLITGLFGGGNMFGARARGGVEMPWRNFIAGEEGAELISQDGPAGARRVATAGRTRHMMGQGGGGTQVTMYIQTPDVESFQKSQGQIASRMNGFLARGQRNQ